MNLLKTIMEIYKKTITEIKQILTSKKFTKYITIYVLD